MISQKAKFIDVPAAWLGERNEFEIFTGCNEVVAKVIFLQACVCPQGGAWSRGCLLPGGGGSDPGGVCSREVSVPGGAWCGGGGGVWSGGSGGGGGVAPPNFFLQFLKFLFLFIYFGLFFWFL